MTPATAHELFELPETTPEPAAPPRPAAAPLRSERVLGSLIAGYALVFGAVAFLKHRFALYADFDLAIFAQALDRLMQSSTFVSIRGMSWLGDHASLLLLPLAPVYALLPHPLTLIGIQTVTLALGAIPVFRMARRALRSDELALACAALYLAYPALGFTNLFQFHPEVLCTTLLLCAFEAAGRRASGAAFAWAAVALLGKEDVALAVFGLGLWTGFARRNVGLAVALCLLSAGWVAVVLGVLRPTWNHGEAEYARMYAAWGETLGAAAANLATHPLQALTALVSTPGNPVDTRLKQEFLLQLALPLAFLPLLAPLTCLAALPVLAAHLLSWRVQQHTIVFQYTALITPVLFVAAIEGLARLGRMRPEAMRGAVLAACVACVASQLLFGPFTPWPMLRTANPIERAWPSPEDRVMAGYRDAALARAPRDGGLVAGFEVLPRVARGDNVHALHHVISGRYTFSSRAYPIPFGVSAVVGDLAQPRLLPYVGVGSAERFRTMLDANGLVPAYATGDVVTFGRDPSAAMVLVEPHPAPAAFDVGADYENEIDLIGVSALRVTDDPHVVEFATDWCRTATLDRVPLMELTLRDASGNPVITHVRPLGYVAWGPSTWAIDTPMREHYRFVLTRELPRGDYALDLRMLWRRAGESGVYRTPDTADGFKTLGFVTLGAPR